MVYLLFVNINMMKYISLVLFFVLPIIGFSQKKALDHTAFNDWKKLESQVISNDGNFVSYTIKPLRGDGYLYIYNARKSKLDSIPRGYGAQFSGNSNFLVFKISAGFDTLRQCELNKIDKKKWPKDSLGIYFLTSDSLIKISKVKSYVLPETGDWLSYVSEYNTFIEEIEKKKSDKVDSTVQVEIAPLTKKNFSFIKCKKNEVQAASPKIEEKKEEDKYKSDGHLYTSFNPITNKTQQYIDVTAYEVSKNGTVVALTTHKKEKEIDSYQLSILEPQSGDYFIQDKVKSSIAELTFNHAETAIAFLTSTDTTENKQYELNYIEMKSRKWQTLVDTLSVGIPVSKSISSNRAPKFDKDDQLLFFGVANMPKEEIKDTLIESEKAVVDVWHYQDDKLQPQQKVQLEDDKKLTDLYVLNLEAKKLLQISNDTLKFLLPDDLESNYLLGRSIESHVASSQWTSPSLEDHYRISVKDGKVDLLKKAVGFGGELSPTGKYYTYFKGDESNHYVVEIATKKEKCVTCSNKAVKWNVDINGQPKLADPEGIVGWVKGENDVLIQSEFDVWNYSISSGKLTSITNEKGKATNTRLSTSVWSNDSVYVDYKNFYIRGFNETTKGNIFYELVEKSGGIELVELYAMNSDLNSIRKSKNGSAIIFRKANVLEYPDLILMDNQFKNEKKISTTNPQQSTYNWATVEKVQWTSYDGIPLEGLVYKPENFDTEKEYPMIVYYYELSSHGLNNHYTPKPSASVINPVEYASAGYVIFMPDIRYREGHPAKSAYDCIMSGTDKVLKLYPNIDSKRMGLQGQSWGGYQTAQLVTMTNRYAAAMAGAPVSNMFSAYGGIRWGSGLNRQFQYEKEQSRIGKTIWEAPELYIENSPLFHLPNVKTPLLIMANDGDGAVPWYQGIELFTGMKRLGKPCWMLNYNGDDHNLMKNANRFDLSIRMRQFFDYYLQNAPAPKWLIDGLPMVEKGEEYRLELIGK